MPSEPRWVDAAAAVALNAEAVRRTGEPHGLRDAGLLESALAVPRNSFFYAEEEDIAVLAASLMAAIARNHPFQQGNKRTAAATGGAFLYANGYTIAADDDAFANLFIAVLEHTAGVETLAMAIRERLSPRE